MRFSAVDFYYTQNIFSCKYFFSYIIIV